MAIWLDKNSKIIVQGMTGSEGTKHTRRMVAGGSNIVAGVTPGKGGQELDGIPVFNSCAEAVAATGANVSVVFVPPKFAKDAVISTIEAEVPLCVVITEGIPVHDTAEFFARAQASGKTQRTIADLTGSRTGWHGDFDVAVTPTAESRVVVTWRDVSELQNAYV